MQNITNLHPPIQYNILWLLVGLALLLVIVSWYADVFWSTRHKKPKSIDDLKSLPPPFDIEAIKRKYTKLIEVTFQKYENKEYGLRQLHLNLNMLVRYFVYEANGFPAPLLSLSDIKMARYNSLTLLVNYYYPEAFSSISRGNAQASKQAAIGLVSQWPL